mmetsp:Transcript_16487/g.28599  ORF Transcript_16487/g.28599 Transcript_16487/m.28599 type:complete len:1610 (-) Transcript_16487:107-4936(-)|eukprot:CAMPEP_0203751348 /NCGR_PEP_ID=MMETSP0098-20131031/5431_1 /ASSEMBLY_ACC=CAM_ASM_000208 /TAXON_ID=96639 /ORGANISM=" , Strain NY0313808BC1" /LENGTH=1609 /DNA_ID=CAMNT_0050641023 /DNA_START=365 /DNA_END=5194 /DNA_ORIENTATION=-
MVFPKSMKQLLTEVLSGIVNGLLMFVFCYVFASLIFEPTEVGLGEYVPLGAGTNTITAFIIGLSFALYSDCAISIAGPDINPTIFFAQMSVKIREYVNDHYSDQDEQEQRTLTTVLFSIILGTALVGLWFFSLGRFRLTRIVQFVPAAVLSGFLAAVGVIVMIKAVKACVGDELAHHLNYWQFWALLAPAIPIGVSLYITKRFHVGSPIVMIPVLLFGPFILFYICVYATGNSLNSVRDMNLCKEYTVDGHEMNCLWLYDKYQAVLLVDQWKYSYGRTDYIEWGAIVNVIPEMLVMLVIVTLDSLLKMSGTKKQLEIRCLDYDHEMQLAGKTNIFLVFMVGAPGYAQLKFNALNSGIIHNTSSRFPGLVASLFNGALFFAGFPLINFLPRFFVGGLLIYAGMGFVVENLLDTWLQNRLSIIEYLTVWVIVVLSQWLGMLVAVVVGVVLSFVIFAIQYGRTGVIKAVLSGKDYQSSVVRSTQEDAKLEHLGAQCVIIKLKRYIFFGSASQITDIVKSILCVSDDEEDTGDTESDYSYASNQKRAKHINTVVFDFEDVYGIDFTACGTLTELVAQLTSPPVQTLHQDDHRELPIADGVHNVGEIEIEMSPRDLKPKAKSQNKVVKEIKRHVVRAKSKPLFTKAYKILFCGMSNNVYKRLKTEGVIDLVHTFEQDAKNVNLVMPKVLAEPRLKKLGKYIRSLFGRRAKMSRHESIDMLDGASQGKDFLDSAGGSHDEGLKAPGKNGFQDFDDDDVYSTASTDVKTEVAQTKSGLIQEYYLNDDFPTEYRRVFPTLDLAMEWVEERLLEQASEIRRRWLVFFDSFRILHEQARLKAQHEPFEHILGGHLGDSVWKYIQAIRVPRGSHLCKAGFINPHLFLLQHGRLTSYMTRADETLVRIQTHRRGAYVNEDALFVEYPLSHTIIADEDSIVLALSRDNLKQLEAYSPDVAFEIHRDVLRHTARTRNKLARELDVVDHWSLHERTGAKQAGYRNVIQQQPGHVRSSRPSSAHLGQFVGARDYTLNDDDSLQKKHVEELEPLVAEGPGSLLKLQTSLNEPLNPSTTKTQESHLASTSRTVGQAILNESKIQLEKEVAKNEEAKAVAQEPPGPLSTSEAGTGSTGHVVVEDVRIASDDIPVRPFSSDRRESKGISSRFKEVLMRAKRPKSHHDSEENLEKSTIAFNSRTLPAPGNRKDHQLTLKELQEDINRSATVHYRREHSRSTGGRPNSEVHRVHTLPNDAGRTTPHPSLCFRPDLQLNHFFLPMANNSSQVNIVDAGLVRGLLHLSQVQRADALACLKRAASNRFFARGARGPGAVRETEGDVNKMIAHNDIRINPNRGLEPSSNAFLPSLFTNSLPKSRLKQTLMDMGHFPSKKELSRIMTDCGCDQEEAVSQETFLRIVRDVSLEQLTDDNIQGFALFFERHSKEVAQEDTSTEIRVIPRKVLTVFGLKNFMEELHHDEDEISLRKMVTEWSDVTIPADDPGKPRQKVLQFTNLCSLMAYHLKIEKLNEQVADDFIALTSEECLDGLITVEDILEEMAIRREPCSEIEAEEMVFEADVSGLGGVTYDDLVETLTTVFESEVEPQLEQLTQDLVEEEIRNIRQLPDIAQE